MIVQTKNFKIDHNFIIILNVKYIYVYLLLFNLTKEIHYRFLMMNYENSRFE